MLAVSVFSGQKADLNYCFFFFEGGGEAND